MKKIFLIILLLILVLTGCKNEVENTSSVYSYNSSSHSSIFFVEDPTAGATVESYFEQFRLKNTESMNKYFHERMKSINGNDGTRYDLLNDVQINKLSEETNIDVVKKKYDNLWYPNPWNIKLFYVNYYIEYIENDEGWESEEIYTEIYLIKEDKNSEWLIIMMGTG